MKEPGKRPARRAAAAPKRTPIAQARAIVRKPYGLVPGLTTGAVTLVVPKAPLFVGSYVRIPVRISAAMGLTFEQLEFRVSDPLGGSVSPSRDDAFTLRRPEIMLLVGALPGTYKLLVYLIGSSTPIATQVFRVTSVWPDVDAGPSLWFDRAHRTYSAGATWGGGPAGPQNEDVHTQSGVRRIAIVLVDTASQRFTSNATTVQSFRDRWMDQVINGVTFAGMTRSTREYYREASFNGFDISADVYGPFNLSAAFSTYINSDGSMTGSFPQSVVTAAQASVNFDNYDGLLVVSQQVDATTTMGRQGAWPYSSIGPWGPYTYVQGGTTKSKTLGVTSMPNDWHEFDGREIHETYSHELGHNLGLGDQYTPVVAGRNPGDWELMHNEGTLPYFSAAHRMMLGWLPAGWILPFDFSTAAAAVDQTVTLSPVELGTPPAGQFAAIEVRIADGWNYYLEYRIGESAEIGDRALPSDSHVLGTDVVSDPGTAPFSRPVILLLPKHGDDAGAVLGNGEFYHEIDTSTGLEFRIDVSNINGAKADVRVRYGANGRPDPSIRPWPASPDRPYQSPDIEVRNAKSTMDPVNFFNTPWLNHDNTVAAQIKNGGNLDAPGVTVNFYVKDYNVGGAPEYFLGTQTKNVAAGATVEFTTNWVPPRDGHFCIIVRIPLYQTPGSPSIAEQTEFNNVAQSNYDRFNSATSSPAHRVSCSVAVGNPYGVPTRVFLAAGQTREDYRVYLEHTWLYLAAGETRHIDLMVEHIGTNPTQDGKPPRLVPTDVSVVSFIENPHASPRHVLHFHGGLQARVATGRATRIPDFNRTSAGLGGTVVTVDNGRPVPAGQVVVVLHDLTRTGIDHRTYHRTTFNNGRFILKKAPEKWVYAQAFYLPAEGYAESESAELRN